jgi:diguanylate cyclase
LSQLDVEADPQACCDTLLSSAHALASSNDKLRDELSLAKRELQSESEPASDPKELLALDELTQISSRQAFDWEIRRQIEQGDTYCLAVMDVDRCAQLNLSYGQTVVDEVLKVVAKIVAASARGECRATRYSGQQFAVLLPSYQPAEAALAVERIRQIVALTQFNHEETRLEVSVSAALIVGQTNDTLQTLEQRVREGIAAVKKNTRNHTYQFQSGQAELISPPELDLKINSYEV